MFEAWFGMEIPLAIRFLVAFLIVLGVIAAAAWAMRRFGTRRLAGPSSARGRQPRLAVIDSVSIDGHRRLILIRRDNVEHLLMTGGPTDVVVAPNIVRAGHDVPAGRSPGAAEPANPLLDQGSRPLLPAPGPAPRSEPLPETPATWPLQPRPEESLRLQRDMLAKELLTRPPAPRQSLTTVATPYPTEPRPEPRVEPRPEPRITTPRPVAAHADAITTSAANESLADLAHRLGAALRKPNAAPPPEQTPAAGVVPPSRSPVRHPRASEPPSAKPINRSKGWVG
jgi:flagellar protein FliO/FliZ